MKVSVRSMGRQGGETKNEEQGDSPTMGSTGVWQMAEKENGMVRHGNLCGSGSFDLHAPSYDSRRLPDGRRGDE